MIEPSLYAFADEAGKMIDTQIAAMKRNHLNGLEIRGVDGESISNITLDKAREVRQKMDDNGLITWSIGSPIGKLKMDQSFEQHLDVYRHTLEVADVLGAKNIRLFSFYIPKGDDPKIYRQLVIDRMGRFLEIARGTGINLCHENEKGIYGDIPERCLELHQIYPELKAIFDPANYVQCGVDTAKGWDLLKDRVFYLHIKDALPNGRVVPAGKGAGNVAHIVKEYLSMGGYAMTLEPHLKVFDGLAALEESGDTSVVGQEYTYPTADAAFDAACSALKTILQEVL